MFIRKKKIIDGMDREILRQILDARRSLTSRQIANKVNLSSSAIIPRLNNLKKQGILKNQKTGIRSFNRVIDNKKRRVEAPRSIFWDLDIKGQIKKEKKDFLFK